LSTLLAVLTYIDLDEIDIGISSPMIPMALWDINEDKKYLFKLALTL
jgi:hypothetical protein